MNFIQFSNRTAKYPGTDDFPEFKNLGEDEAGYITMYFQVALENRTLRKKVMIVCSSGVGTSHLLSARVKRAFPEWEIVDIVSAIREGDEKQNKAWQRKTINSFSLPCFILFSCAATTV